MKNSVLHKKTGNKKQKLDLGNVKKTNKHVKKEQNKLNKNKKNAQFYKLNKDTVKKKNKQYKKLNKDTVHEKNKQYYKLNKDTLNEKKKAVLQAEQIHFE